MSSIYRQLNIEVDREIAQKLGIEFNEDEADNKKINIVNKDSLVIRRWFTLSQLTMILKKAENLSRADDNFVLSYLLLAKKKAYKNSELFDWLIITFKEKKYNSFVLVGDEYENYILNTSKYIIKDSEDKVFLECIEPIKISDIYNKFETDGIRLSQTFIHEFLKKWTVSTEDESGMPILPATKIFEAIQGYLEFGANNEPIYLFYGEWYVFDTKYSTALNNEYEFAFENYTEKNRLIYGKFSLLHKAKNEDTYNKVLENENKILVTHTGSTWAYVFKKVDILL